MSELISLAFRVLIRIQMDLTGLYSNLKLFAVREDQSDELVASAKQESLFNSWNYLIDSIYGQYRSEKTDLLGFRLLIRKQNCSVAKVGIRLFGKKRAFNVQIDQSENQPFILSLAIILFHVCFF